MKKVFTLCLLLIILTGCQRLSPSRFEDEDIPLSPHASVSVISVEKWAGKFKITNLSDQRLVYGHTDFIERKKGDHWYIVDSYYDQQRLAMAYGIEVGEEIIYETDWYISSGKYRFIMPIEISKVQKESSNKDVPAEEKPEKKYMVVEFTV